MKRRAKLIASLCCGLLTAGWTGVGLGEEKAAAKPVKKVAEDVKVQVVQAGGANFRMLGGAVNPLSPERDEVLSTDNQERFLLLAAGGPVLMQASMTIDGKPFRQQREELIAKLIKAADRNADGTTTWQEVGETPSSMLNPLMYNNVQGEAREKMLAQGIKQRDTNQNGNVDASEVRLMLASMYGGATFNASSNPYANPNNQIRKLLDQNEDGQISAAEMEQAADRLKSRDANDDDLLDATEIGGQANLYAGRAIVNGRIAVQNTVPLVVVIGPHVAAEELFKALVAAYAPEKQKTLTASCFPRNPELVKALDVNQNQQIDADELKGLNLMAPDVDLEIRIGKLEEGQQPVVVKHLAKHLGSADQAIAKKDNGMMLKLPGVQVSLLNAPQVRYQQNYEQYGERMLGILDTDKNGYIEEKEIKETQYRAYAQQFPQWDADGNGKVYAKEISEYFSSRQLPNMTQVSLAAINQGDALLSNLDQTGDSRLSLREMRTAAQQLKRMDANQDGNVTSEEIPVTIGLTFSQGSPQYGYSMARVSVVQGRGGMAGRNNLPKAKGPEWFVRMDRNGDGDITPREFLGGDDKFNELDADGDGFITLQEAEALEKKTTQAAAEATPVP